MHTTDRGLLALIRHEGVVPGPYLDVKDVWTFGIGHTAAAGPPRSGADAARDARRHASRDP
jgi:lysozyme